MDVASEPIKSYNDYLTGVCAMEDIDMETAMETAGGPEVYEAVCRNFHDTALTRIDMLRDAFDARDLENYTIQVHALKTTARLIGAFSLSERALSLEQAGRASDRDPILEKTDGLHLDYRALYEAFGLLEAPKDDSIGETDRPPLSPEELKEKLSDMRELLEAFDFDTASELFESLNDYALPEDFRETYAKMKTLMAEVERDGLIQLINERL